MARPRLCKIVGGWTYNDRDQNVGEVDDVLLTPSELMAVMQIGGFLGFSGPLFAMPLGDLRQDAERERVVLPGASKKSLEPRSESDHDTTCRR